MTMERFLPTTTTVQIPVAGAISTFSATQVVLSTTHALTQLGNAIATLGSNVLHFFRNRPDTNGTETLNINSSSITITDNDTDNATNTITTTEQSLERTHREVQPQVVTDETDEIRTDITVPQTTMTNTASTTIALRNQVPVINISGIQYTLEDIADMTREERNALVASHPDILRIQYHGREWFNVYDLFYNDQLIIHNNVFQRRTLIRPADIEMTDRIHRATDNNWSIEWEGTTYTARDIEQLSMQDRLNLPFVQNGDIGLEPYLNDQTMEAWINIIDHRGETIDPIVATIDYSAPTTANISGGQVRFVGINSQIEVNANGVRYQHYDLVATTDTWTVPGTTPAITARMIEQMSDEQRGELMDNIYSHGNLLAFNDTLDETTGEEITQVLYNGNVVATIDRRRLHVINIVNGVIEMYQQDGVISATTQVIMGAVGYVARRFLHGQWQFVRHHPGDAAAIAGVAAEAYVANRIGLFNIPSWFRRNDNPETLAEEDVLEKILAWAYHEETDDEPELEITMKDADKMMVSFDTCINIAKTYRDTLKGTIAFMCEKIKELENKSSTKHPLEDIDMTAYITKVEVKEMIDQKDAYIDTLEARLAALEAKCANIE